MRISQEMKGVIMRNLCGTVFYIKTNVLQDFRICMSVPLTSKFFLKFQHSVSKSIEYFVLIDTGSCKDHFGFKLYDNSIYTKKCYNSYQANIKKEQEKEHRHSFNEKFCK